MSVAQLKDGRWICRFPRGKDKANPNKICKYFGRGDEAELKAHEFNRHLGLGDNKESSEGKTFDECATIYLNAKINKISKKGFDTAFMHIHKHLSPFLGNLPIMRINDKLIDEYVNNRVYSVWKKSNGHKNAETVTGIKNGTINRELTTLKAVLNLCAKRKEIPYNPILHYEKLKDDDEIIPEATKDELDAILKVAFYHLKRFIILAYYTTARPGESELLKVKWSHIDFSGNSVFIESAKKGGIVSRRIPIHPVLAEHLAIWFEEDKARKTMPEYVIHYHGNKVGNLSKSWRTAKSKAKILRRLRLYDIRHSSITHQLEAGGDLKAVSINAGHSNPAMTMRRYQHVSPQLREKAISGLVHIGTQDEETENAGRQSRRVAQWESATLTWWMSSVQS